MRQDHHPFRVLIVDDNDDDIELLRIAVANAHAPWTVLSARNVEEGRAVMRGASVPAGVPLPDLVLLDWRMPGSESSELLRNLRSDPATVGTPVLVLTSSDAPEDVRTALSLHANAFLLKPGDYAGYQRLVEGIDAFWRRLALSTA